ncbi:Putative metal-dependent hydrolase of the TIM-barrel fold protein [Aminobacter niigataensis]|nr:Putative metal-dependent hydrolase of the TIM-barrel fold protein [Aminobacter niigataensis]
MAGSFDRPRVVNRRGMLWLLGAAAALSVTPGCARWRPEPGRCALTSADPVIDVHCHFFNASDVPVRGFVEYVALGELRDEFLPRADVQTKGLFNGLIAFLVDILSRGAKDAPTEAARLRSGTPLEPASVVQQRKTQILADAIQEMDRRARGIETFGRGVEGLDVEPDYPALMEQLAKDAVRPQAFSRSRALSRVGAIGLANGLQRQPSEMQRYIYFALLLLDDREAIAREYLRVFAPSGCVSLVTPSFLDMENWLGNSRARSSIAEQIEVMDLLQVQIARTTELHMHSFVGFDPWREAEGGGSLKLVKRAILDCGFVGVKLYPPMGFQAFGNGEIRFPKGAPGGMEMETALRRLYAWCESNDVPIMAHAENSLGSLCGYGHRASPSWWREALREFPKLRVNLAHFGSFDELRTQPAPKRCSKDAFGKDAWEFIVGKTISEDGREHLFADLGYLYELTSPQFDDRTRSEIRGYLKQFQSRYDPDVRHLLYGTDWTMIAKELDNNNYMYRLGAQLTAAGYTPEQQQNIYWRNAARYLGLGKTDKTRNRLRDYCLNRKIDADWLSAFDQ